MSGPEVTLDRDATDSEAMSKATANVNSKMERSPNCNHPR